MQKLGIASFSENVSYLSSMAKKAPLSALHKPVHPILSLVLIFIGLAGFVGIVALALRSSQYPQHQIYQTHPLAPTPTQPVIDTRNIHYQTQTYISHDLGISFDYVSSSINPEQVKEVDNKVYLYNSRTQKDDPTSGKYVEVFSKNPSDTLADAIRKQVLQGYSATECNVKYAAPYWPYHPDYETATILYSGYDGSDTPNPNAAKCPAIYTRTHGISYFAMDKNHPDKFVFFKIGQDNIPATIKCTGVGCSTAWDETFRFTY